MAKKHPFWELEKLVREDPEYAWSVHCNLAVPIMDELRCPHQAANEAAARIMMQWFKVDMKRHDHWESLERQWALAKVEEEKTEAECVAELN